MSNDICGTTDLHVDECDCQRHRAPSKPGLYPGIDERLYHADKASISSTQARRLLDVSPAQWIWERDNPTPKSADYFDLGTAVHTLVLGAGAPVVDAGYDSWQTKAAKEARAAHRAAGAVPLRSQDYLKARAMADAVRAQPTVARWLACGEPELSLWHPDPDTGVMLRSRADWVHWITADSALIVDLKTSPATGPEEFRKSVRTFRYHCQQAWYQGGFAELGFRTAFVFVVVSDEPPHLPYIVELVPEAVELGERINRRALDLYAACLGSGVWPDHGIDIHSIDLPRWAYTQEEYAL